MNITKTRIEGVCLIAPERFADERGFFARVWSEREFGEAGLAGPMAEANISFNPRRGTLRGMHYQQAPHGQAKLVRCTAGAVYDVAVDLRPRSPTFRQWVGAELTAANRLMLYIPEGLAHGYLTLGDDSEVFYLVSGAYAPEAARGVRWDDPAFGIEWPTAARVINDRDRAYPDFAA
jgi:dTDP-4-dehydrorhamnose 3,5-epimerase